MSLLHATDDVSDITPMLDIDAETAVSRKKKIFFFVDLMECFLFLFQPLLSNSVPIRQSRAIRFKNAITMFVLFMINLLNFMDRFAIPGI